MNVRLFFSVWLLRILLPFSIKHEFKQKLKIIDIYDILRSIPFLLLYIVGSSFNMYISFQILLNGETALSILIFQIIVLLTPFNAWVFVTIIINFGNLIYNVLNCIKFLLGNLIFYVQGWIVVLVIVFDEVSVALDCIFCFLSVADINLGFKWLSWTIWILTALKLFLPKLMVECDLTTIYIHNFYSQSGVLENQLVKALKNNKWRYLTCNADAKDLKRITGLNKLIVFGGKNNSMDYLIPEKLERKFKWKTGHALILDKGEGNFGIGIIREGIDRSEFITVDREKCAKFSQLFDLMEANGNSLVVKKKKFWFYHCLSLQEISVLFDEGAAFNLVRINKNSNDFYLGDPNLDYLVSRGILNIKMSKTLHKYCKLFFNPIELPIGIESLSCLLTSNCVLFKPLGIGNAKFKIFCSDINHIFKELFNSNKKLKKCSTHNPTASCLEVIEFEKTLCKAGQAFTRTNDAVKLRKYNEGRKLEKSRKINSNCELEKDFDIKQLFELQEYFYSSGEDTAFDLELNIEKATVKSVRILNEKEELEKLISIEKEKLKLEEEAESSKKQEETTSGEVASTSPIEKLEGLFKDINEQKSYDSIAPFEFRYPLLVTVSRFIENERGNADFFLNSNENWHCKKLKKKVESKGLTMDHHIDEGVKRIQDWKEDKIKTVKEIAGNKKSNILKSIEIKKMELRSIKGFLMSIIITNIDYRQKLFYFYLLKEGILDKNLLKIFKNEKAEILEIIESQKDKEVFPHNEKINQLANTMKCLKSSYVIWKDENKIGGNLRDFKGQEINFKNFNPNDLIRKIKNRSCKKLKNILKTVSMGRLTDMMKERHKKLSEDIRNFGKPCRTGMVINNNSFNKIKKKIPSSIAKEIDIRFVMKVKSLNNNKDFEKHLLEIMGMLKRTNVSVRLGEQKLLNTCLA